MSDCCRAYLNTIMSGIFFPAGLVSGRQPDKSNVVVSKVCVGQQSVSLVDGVKMKESCVCSKHYDRHCMS